MPTVDFCTVRMVFFSFLYATQLLRANKPADRLKLLIAL